MSRKLLLARVAAVLAALLVVGAGFAQQPPPPQPPPPQPGGQQPSHPPPARPGPGPGQLPPGHPAVPGGGPMRPMPGGGPMRPGQPFPGQPGPGQVGPGGRPFPQPGQPRPGQPVRPRPAAVEEPAAKHGAAHCPGHGPMDPPGHFNFGHGLLGVNNEKAPPPGSSAWIPTLWRYENKADECDPRNEPPPFLASLINFGFLVFLIVRFGRRPIAEALVKRKESIMQEIDTAARLKEDAKKRLKDYKRKFTNIEDTLGELTSEYAAQAEAEKARILAEAEERRARMRRDAEFRIDQELKAARVELLNEAVLGAAAAAEEIIKRQVAAADHDRINDDYLASLGKAMKDEGARLPSGGGAGGVAGRPLDAGGAA